MQDPVKTIKDLLYDNWFKDDEDIDRAKITWRIGPPKNPANRFNENRLSFEFDDMTESRRKRTLKRSQARRIVTADFWRQLNPDSDREELKAETQDIIDKVDIIITANERLATDLDFVYVGVGPRNLDRVDEGYVRAQLEIVCVHQK